MLYSTRIHRSFAAVLFFALISPAGDLCAQGSENRTLIGRFASGPCYEAEVSGNIVYFGNGPYLEIMDFSDPANPVAIGRFLTRGVPRSIAGDRTETRKMTTFR